MTCFITVFGPRQHIFLKNSYKMIDHGQRGQNVFMVVLVFLTVSFYCDCIGIWLDTNMVSVSKYLKGIVKWAEPCECVILIISSILWH